MKKYKVIVLDEEGNERALESNKEEETLTEMIFYSEESKIYFYEDMKGKFPDCSIKMMLCQ
ncbi:hypothetical protein CR194_17480 [Salipaludibacillus keqinensis]|uniref:Uncharacterized protein n=1 Tax=Salipaludibacillus keqinensis TaxID=2045207 RepID=A0A323T971_9BACI|nr:hypothetical protein [Salipaludibacillus keqinensis]PYZ91989.1 hypothetical protein CR194_17480 [Salipaludibacillus keqinensis]